MYHGADIRSIFHHAPKVIDLVGEYLTVFNNTDVNSVESFEAFLDKYSFEYLIVDSKNRMLPYLMMNEDYDDVLYGNGYVVFRAI